MPIERTIARTRYQEAMHMNDEKVENRETGKILIVDDKPENLRLLFKLLSEQRYTVHPAASADVALAFLKHNVPDLILLDIRMPGMDGYELCRMFKKQPATCDIPVIFLSAEHQIEEKSKAYACGGIDYITKPFQEEEVLLRVKTHLTLRNLQRRLEERVRERTADLTALSEKLESLVHERTRDLELAMEKLSAANDRLLSLSLRDGLTGLKNRRFFDECITREWDRAKRASASIALLMIDIDHFKHINDTYGHLVGDECLKAVAQETQNTLRRSADEVARYGGEEFAVILPNTSVAGATQIAEEIRCRLERTAIVVGDMEVRITASIGVAHMIPSFGQASSKIVADADRALYQAKKSGRNRIVCADDSDALQAEQAE
jgi:diguanylate cyclase (GGDEF)-like protein